jgi:VWFA-related protein
MKRNLIFILAIIAAGFVLIGCSGGGGGEAGSATPSPPVSSISTQSSLDFGVAVIGGTSSRQLLISNVGIGTLNIGQISLPSNSLFQITTDNCSNASIPSAGTCDLALRLTPAAQINYSDGLTIPSNDRTKTPLTVALTGKGRALNVKINEVKTDGCGMNPKVLKLLISVTNSAGGTVTGLTSDRFTAIENGSPKPINVFTHPIMTPISFCLVLDYSIAQASSANKDFIQNAAKNFIDLLQVTDQASIIKFATDISAKTAFTLDHTALKSAIDAPYPGDISETRLYEALYAAIDDTAVTTTDRHAIVVISDGNDDNSGTTKTLTDVIDRAIEKNVPIFTIGYLNDPSYAKPEILNQIAQETGGLFFETADLSTLDTIYSTISQVLSNQYLIEYNSSSFGGTSVSLDVEVDDNGNLGEDSKEATGC